jgi:DNA-binding NarL/FixJ family response regulator
VHEAVMVGARGYLAKQDTPATMLDCLSRMAVGATGFSPHAEACLVDGVRASAGSSDAAPSARESEMLPLLAAGATAREVGERLFVSEATVKTHLRRLYGKLTVTDRAAAVAEAMRRGWVV